MDVINAYLETMFSPYPQTPRLLEAKEDLRGMMEDAYNEAIAAGRSNNEAVGKVITEFGNLDELAPVLGIASDIRPTTTPSAFPDLGAASPTGGFSPTAGTFSPAESYGSSGSYGSTPGSTYDEFSYSHPAHPTITLQEAMAYSEGKVPHPSSFGRSGRTLHSLAVVTHSSRRTRKQSPIPRRGGRWRPYRAGYASCHRRSRCHAHHAAPAGIPVLRKYQ